MRNIKNILSFIKNLNENEFKIAYDEINKYRLEMDKKKKEDEINKQFLEKGVQCPKCDSFHCIKNGHKDNRQKYLCKKCKASFDAMRDHFTFRSRFDHEVWEWFTFLTSLGVSCKKIGKGLKIHLNTAWRWRHKLMKALEIIEFKTPVKLRDRIEIDESFIKEIHKGNFKDKKDPRRQYIKSESKDYNTCIVFAIDEHNQIFVDNTNTKKMQVEYVQKVLTNQLIQPGSILVSDKLPIYKRVVFQTNSIHESYEQSDDKEKVYKQLKNVSKLQSDFKEFIYKFHGLGFTNIKKYLRLWKWQYITWIKSKRSQFKSLYFFNTQLINKR